MEQNGEKSEQYSTLAAEFKLLKFLMCKHF